MTSRLVLTALAAAALAACAKDNASVEVAAICAAPDDAVKCSFPAKCAAQTLADIALDVDAADDLWLPVQVNNQNLSNADPATFRSNSRDAFVHEAVTSIDGGPVRESRDPVTGSALVPANGRSVIGVRPIDSVARAAYASALTADSHIDVIAHVRLRGAYADTTEFETGDFDIPIRVCKGCFAAPACPSTTPVAVFCPQPGQSPASYKCVAP